MIERPSGDEGLTLVEMMVALSLLLVALVMFGNVLFAVQKASSRGDQLSRASDAAYMALTEMDRQLRSGYIASTTAVGGTLATVRILTEAYTPAGSQYPVPRCVVWSVVDMGSGRQGLYTAWWNATPNSATTPTFSSGKFSAPVTAYRLITDEIVDASPRDTFRVLALTGPPTSLGQRLLVTFRIREATDRSLISAGPVPSGSPSPWVNVIWTTITPRNVPRGQDVNADTAAYEAYRENLCG